MTFRIFFLLKNGGWISTLSTPPVSAPVEVVVVVMVVAVVVEYLEGVIFSHRLHPLQIPSVLLCTKEGHNAKMWGFLVFLAVVLLN